MKLRQFLLVVILFTTLHACSDSDDEQTIETKTYVKKEVYRSSTAASPGVKPLIDIDYIYNSKQEITKIKYKNDGDKDSLVFVRDNGNVIKVNEFKEGSIVSYHLYENYVGNKVGKITHYLEGKMNKERVFTWDNNRITKIGSKTKSYDGNYSSTERVNTYNDAGNVVKSVTKGILISVITYKYDNKNSFELYNIPLELAVLNGYNLTQNNSTESESEITAEGKDSSTKSTLINEMEYDSNGRVISINSHSTQNNGVVISSSTRKYTY